jgi:hypothetical protein
MLDTATVTAPRTAGPALWRRVLTATSIGWALGIVLGVGLVVLVESLGVQGFQTPLVLGIALGLGTQQFRALRHLVPGRGTHWVAGTCLGLTAPFVAADVAVIAEAPLPFSLVPYVGIGGLLAGVLQWGVLRSVARRAAAWLVGAPLGCLAAASTVWLNERVLSRTPGIVGALQYLGVIVAGGLVFGAVAGVAASRLQPHRPPGLDV